MGDAQDQASVLGHAIERANRLAPERGPSPLHAFGLVLHHDGSWSHQGEPFLNRRLREKFDRSVRYLPDEGGVYVVQIGRYRGLIEVEEAAFFVEALDLSAGLVRLSDATTDVLDVVTLSVSTIDGALLCRVKGELAAEPPLARFTHRAQSEFLNAVDEAGIGVRVRGRLLALPTL